MGVKKSQLTFSQEVWAATKKIPKGKVATYASIAQMIKRPHSARAVGNALNANPYAPVVPCHRVVKSDGSVGGFASGPKKKIALLTAEGVVIIKDKVTPLKRYLFSK
jgi:methylated-DNA-[protein]-cysteine S-methyltransferase